MLKFEGVADVGEYIKAMDFRHYEDRDDMFVIGQVTAKGLIEHLNMNGYTIECGYDTEGGRVGVTMFIPYEVSPADWDDRVQYVTAEAYQSIVSGS